MSTQCKTDKYVQNPTCSVQLPSFFRGKSAYAKALFGILYQSDRKFVTDALGNKAGPKGGARHNHTMTVVMGLADGESFGSLNVCLCSNFREAHGNHSQNTIVDLPEVLRCSAFIEFVDWLIAVGDTTRIRAMLKKLPDVLGHDGNEHELLNKEAKSKLLATSPTAGFPVPFPVKPSPQPQDRPLLSLLLKRKREQSTETTEEPQQKQIKQEFTGKRKGKAREVIKLSDEEYDAGSFSSVLELSDDEDVQGPSSSQSGPSTSQSSSSSWVIDLTWDSD
ncbi:hypothetical protein BDP27DRAFT_1362737 [Rhodocollybia butyracea]|uniref:Uncharacterized protein n=1 Tax=Rhodocollybia butyracea TaxID=206335 RepID=A0A9P5PYB3_9AGAR|nr:hypothetical protein BDP27DRAFT_1362737 [Rhodocollybia butyracea]